MKSATFADSAAVQRPAVLVDGNPRGEASAGRRNRLAYCDPSPAVARLPACSALAGTGQKRMEAVAIIFLHLTAFVLRIFDV